MAGGIFRVGVTVFLMDRATMGLMGITRSIASATTASRALRAEMAGIQTAMRVGVGMTFIGAAGLATMGKMVEHASEFQINMVRVQNLFKVSTEQARLFKNELFEISHKTMFSAENISDVALGMKSVGLNFENITKLLPQFSAAAEILFRVSKGAVGPQQTGAVLGEFAHTLGVYDPKGLARLSEVLVNAAQLIPGGPSALVTQLGYLKPAQIMTTPPGNLTAAQREEFQIQGGIRMVELAAIAQQIVGARGGTGARGPLSGPSLLAFMLGGAGVGTTLTGFSFIQNQLARAALGFLDPRTGASPAMRGGMLDPLAEMGQAQSALRLASTLEGQRKMIQSMVTEMGQMHLSRKQVESIMTNPLIAGPLAGRVDNPGAIVDLFGKMMGGQTGMRALSVLSLPGTATAFNQLVGTMMGAPGITQQQIRFLETLQGRWAQFTTDVRNLGVEIGLTLIPRTTQLVTVFDNLAEKMRLWIEAHPRATQVLAAMTVGLSALTAFGGVAIFLVAVGRALSIIAGAGTLLGGGAVLVAVGIALVELYKHFDAFKRILHGYPNLETLINHPMATLSQIFTNMSKKAKDFGDWLQKMFPSLFPSPTAGATGGTTLPPVVTAWISQMKDVFTPGGPLDLYILGKLDAFVGWMMGPGPATKKPTAFWGSGAGTGTTPVGFTVSPGGVVIHVHGDINGEATIEKLRRSLHEALLSIGGGGAGVYESGLTHSGAIGV